MILLGYIILGHPDWKHGEIKLFAIFPEEEIDEQRERLMSMVAGGRLPISAKNVELISRKSGASKRAIIQQRSRDADLIIVGFIDRVLLLHEKQRLFEGYDGLGNVLFVNTTKEIRIHDVAEDEAPEPVETPPGLVRDEPPETEPPEPSVSADTG